MRTAQQPVCREGDADDDGIPFPIACESGQLVPLVIEPLAHRGHLSGTIAARALCVAAAAEQPRGGGSAIEGPGPTPRAIARKACCLARAAPRSQPTASYGPWTSSRIPGRHRGRPSRQPHGPRRPAGKRALGGRASRATLIAWRAACRSANAGSFVPDLALNFSSSAFFAFALHSVGRQTSSPEIAHLTPPLRGSIERLRLRRRLPSGRM